MTRAFIGNMKCEDKKSKNLYKIGLNTGTLFKKRKRGKKTKNSFIQKPKNNQVPESLCTQGSSATKRGNNVIISENIKTNVSVIQMSSKCKNNFISLKIPYDIGLGKCDEFNCVKSSLFPRACKSENHSIENSDQDNVKPIRPNDNQHDSDVCKVIECDGNKIASYKKCKTASKYSITVRTSDSQATSAIIHELNCSKCLVILKPESYIYFAGIVELELVQGSVEVLGYSLHESKKKLVIFSPLCSSHLFIKATTNHMTFKRSSAKGLKCFELPPKMCREVLKDGENNTIFILTTKKSHVCNSVWPLLFENHLSFSIFPQSSLNRPCHIIESKIGEKNIPEHGKEIVELFEWQNIVEEIHHIDSPKVVLCGGKSVGKSTFLRYLINKCLKKWNKVLVIDFDPGQCEFTISGCISVNLVEEPVLGPNFTHLQEAVRSIFLGEVDVKKCPEDYIEGCKTLIKYADCNFKSTPWLINTMGFSRGFGVTLICGIIQNLGPTNVVQIESKSDKFNFPSPLEPGFVYSQNVGSFGPSISHKMYNFHLLPSAPEHQSKISHRQRDINPAEARRLVILSYLSYMLKSGASLTQVTPYMINIDLLNLRTTNKNNLSKTEIAATMNGNLVALCSQKEDDVFPNCHGFGIVRGVDVEAGLLYIITPVASKTLRKINCLIKGSVALPDSLYYNPGHKVRGHIPYMAHTSGGSTALFAKRDYRTLPTTKSKT